MRLKKVTDNTLKRKRKTPRDLYECISSTSRTKKTRPDSQPEREYSEILKKGEKKKRKERKDKNKKKAHPTVRI